MTLDADDLRRSKLEEEVYKEVNDEVNRQKSVIDSLLIQDGWKMLINSFFKPRNEFCIQMLKNIKCPIEEIRYYQGQVFVVSEMEKFLNKLKDISEEDILHIVNDEVNNRLSKEDKDYVEKQNNA